VKRLGLDEDDKKESVYNVQAPRDGEHAVNPVPNSCVVWRWKGVTERNKTLGYLTASNVVG
jgi:hypothetical protein